MSEYPPEVEAFHLAMRRLVAVGEVSTGLKLLADLGPETYSLPGEFGDLPHALLRRTGGGLPGECWVITEFELMRGEAGWLTLEFLAWWIRDQSRGGTLIQMRPMALPPKTFEVQLGGTLKFIIDVFVTCPNDDITPALAEMRDRARFLSLLIDAYADVLGPIVRTKKAPDP